MRPPTPVVSEHTSANSIESAMKHFRSRVFKPAEGVFLFHPRAMERLIVEHLEPLGHDGSVPPLSYYLMPCSAFLDGLETENPEALAVIEGLSLPDQIILLPMPLELEGDPEGLRGALRDYWARRFEGEIARAWQRARDDNQDGQTFGPTGLRHLIGDIGCAEVREVLSRDNVIPAGLDEATVCRSFVALVVRLRYFSPGARGFFFPAVRDWRRLDAWLIESGLDLPSPGSESRLPQLLERARPELGCGDPAFLPSLPRELPYGCTDPDFQPTHVVESGPEDGMSDAAPPEVADLEQPAGGYQPQSAGPEARCLAALRQGLQLPRNRWTRRLEEWLLTLVAPVLEVLLALPDWLGRSAMPRPTARGLRLEVYLLLFRHAIRTAQRAELQDRYAAAVSQLATAARLFSAMGEPCAPDAVEVHRRLSQRRMGAEDALASLVAADWKLSPDAGQQLGRLVHRLGAGLSGADRARVVRALLRDLEKVLLEGRTTYYQLRPFAWLAAAGRIQIRQILPFQASLKALRLLDGACGRVERLGWPIPEIDRALAPLQALTGRVGRHLDRQLTPHLQRALHEAGFEPRSHPEEVAFHKLLRELLDVIQHRRHLKFTDMRDIVARNILRLPDLSVDELLRGDRLARFDKSAAKALPGVYRPGEIYIKGLQQLGAPLFGTPRGRLVLRHFLLPVALAFIGLKTIDVLIALATSGEPPLHLARLPLVAGVALAVNAIAYTRVGRLGAKAFIQGLWWGIRLVLFEGLRRLARWHPVSRILDTELVRGLDRNLLRPFLLGAVVLVPVLGIVSLVEGRVVAASPTLGTLALAIGLLGRNTPAGRRLLDDLASATGRLLRRLNQTLVIGLIQELMQFFKELTRRFQQALHRVEERLSHHLGESAPELVIKSLLTPVWHLLESFIQFYVTVLVEPQINPIKHFPLVTVAHKLLLPFLPLITGLLADLLEPIVPKWIGLPFVTLTVLLLPGLAGFLVWELKENWKLYAANHAGVSPALGLGPARQVVTRADLPAAQLEPAIVGSHGETMRAFLRRGFHTGTLPKAFERLRSVLRYQIRTEQSSPTRLRDAQRHLSEVEQLICVFCDRELAYPLQRRCKEPSCGLALVTTGRPRLATASFELTIELTTKTAMDAPGLELRLAIWLVEPDLHLEASLTGANERLGAPCLTLIRQDLEVFAARAGATVRRLDLET